jgi:hypothetical protein
VTGFATFDFHGFMLEYERSSLIGVTREAHDVLSRGSANLLRCHRAMRIVTVGALDQAFIYTVVKRHGELRFLLQMARVAKLGLRFN